MSGARSATTEYQNRARGIGQWRRRALANLVLTVFFMLCACSEVSVTNAEGERVRMSREDFAEYAEATFRHHNRVVSELITVFSMSDEDIPFTPALIRSEEDMAARCKPLNEMVLAMIEGREQSFWARLKLLNQVPLCELATQRVEQLIPTIL
tara:strand:- start:33 stop:491 length:459 start_codon:yes stop_codon:yes gene_type:complete